MELGEERTRMMVTEGTRKERIMLKKRREEEWMYRRRNRGKMN